MDNHSAGDIRNAYRQVRNEHTTGIELYLRKRPLRPDEPVRIFQHTMKTGGTALRALIYANLSASAEYVAHDAPKSSKGGDLGRWYRGFVDGLSRDHRSRLSWVVGHTAAHSAPFLEPQGRIITVVREPVDRVISRHWFTGRLNGSETRAERIESLRLIYQSPERVERKRHKGYSNFQSTSILSPYHDVTALQTSKGRGPDADLWRRRLADVTGRCELLVQDRLDEGVDRLSAHEQWHYTALPKVRVNRERPVIAELDPELREAIADYNWLDVELYHHAVRHNEGLRTAAREIAVDEVIAAVERRLA